MISICNRRWLWLPSAAALALCFQMRTILGWKATWRLPADMPRQHKHQRCRRNFYMMTSTLEPPSSVSPNIDSLASKPSSTVIVGGGPAGLATALMLARRGYSGIRVYERLEEPPKPSSSEWGNPERSYNLGLGSRGQMSLTELGVAEKVFSWCADAVGRMDWTPQTPQGTERIYTGRKYITKVIARDRLTSCLLEEARENYSNAIKVEFGVECTKADWHEATGGEGATLTLVNKTSGDIFQTRADFVVGADGVNSAIRDGLEKEVGLVRRLSGRALRVKRFSRKNEFVYKVIAFRLKAGCRTDLNYSHRTKEDINLEALPTKEGTQVGVLLFRPDDQRVLGLKSAADARTLFQDLFPPLMEMSMISEEAYERLASQSASRLPSFSYAGPILHLGRSAVLLGDAIKSVKPYFGLGANSALEDCMTLGRCLDEAGDDLSQALPTYSRKRAPEARDLVELSRGFDRTGLRGFLGFIVPLIVDGICHKLLPRVFAPNTIAFLQRSDYSFTQIRRRKSLDRIIQGVLLATLAALLVSVTTSTRAVWAALNPAVAGAVALLAKVTPKSI